MTAVGTANAEPIASDGISVVDDVSSMPLWFRTRFHRSMGNLYEVRRALGCTNTFEDFFDGDVPRPLL